LPFEPDSVGGKVGLEIHQQLSTRSKLFCHSRVIKSDDNPLSFIRRLRPTQSELGHLDPAAIFEYNKGKVNVYRWNPASACLVEADEETPHDLNSDALESAILIALSLGSNIVDEVHVMRKIVVDGSNTTGFQRTSVVALGGTLTVDDRNVGVQTITVEEDAARILSEDATARHFALDRLGVPLVEIALAPVKATPAYVEKVALHLGRVLRSTGRVARGLGTIRQDLNISVMVGEVVEIKGVQRLNLISKVVSYELLRQVGLTKIAEQIKTRGVTVPHCVTGDVSDCFKDTKSQVLKRTISSEGAVQCIGVEDFAGLLGLEPFPGIRLGKELAEIARANSLGGIIHSDEFEKNEITNEEDASIRKKLSLGYDAALIHLAGQAERV
jgi:glutamyl-tRNA(Gln) amidotransferase subunit E